MIKRPPTTSTDDVLARLESLAAASEDLKHALGKRKPEAIMTALAGQEECVQWLRTQEAQGSEWDDLFENEPEQARMRQLVQRIRTAQRINHAMSLAFLDVVNRTLAHIGRQVAGAASTYGSSGRLDTEASPVLIHRKG